MKEVIKNKDRVQAKTKFGWMPGIAVAAIPTWAVAKRYKVANSKGKSYVFKAENVFKDTKKLRQLMATERLIKEVKKSCDGGK